MRAHASNSNSFRDFIGHFLASCSYSAGAVADCLVDHLAVSVVGAVLRSGSRFAGGYLISSCTSVGLAIRR